MVPTWNLIFILVVLSKVDDQWRWAGDSNPPLNIDERPELAGSYFTARYWHGSRFAPSSKHPESRAGCYCSQEVRKTDSDIHNVINLGEYESWTILQVSYQKYLKVKDEGLLRRERRRGSPQSISHLPRGWPKLFSKVPDSPHGSGIG